MYAAPRPHRSPTPRAAPWLFSAAVTVAAAAVVIVLVLTNGGGSPGAGPSHAPVTRSAGPGPSSPAGPSTSVDAAPANAPTTDSLPSNTGSSNCGTHVQPGLVAVAVATALGGSRKGAAPSPYVADVLRDCTSAPVRSRLELLYGVEFGSDYSDDLTGNDGSGQTAQYRVSNEAGTGMLTLTLTRQQDGHYEVTAYSYSG